MGKKELTVYEKQRRAAAEQLSRHAREERIKNIANIDWISNKGHEGKIGAVGIILATPFICCLIGAGSVILCEALQNPAVLQTIRTIFNQ